MGALATQTAAGDVALSGLGSNVAQFLGAGVGTTTVIGAGLAGDVYNRALDMGLTEDEAAEAAHGTFVDNSKWFALNGLSWGIQFGGLSGRAFKQFNRMKGGAESAKVIQKTFGQRLRGHALKGGLVGTAEGTEEMFQETYEEWIQQKNLAEVQGKEFVSYTDFLTSDENRKTLGVSFAAGFLMGGRGGFMDSVAENGRRITNKRISIDDDINMYENMSDAQKKVRTNEIIEAAVREDQIDGLNGFLDKMQSSGKISAEERAEYDATIEAYAEVAATLPFQDKLTETGQQTLFNIKVKELQHNQSLRNLDVLKSKSIKEANENLEGDALTQELRKIDLDYNNNKNAINIAIAEGKAATAKLLAGKKQSGVAKKADSKRLSAIESFKETEEYNELNDAQKAELDNEAKSLKERIKENSYAIDEANEVADGLTQEEYEQFTKEGETEKAEREKQQAEDVVDKVVDKTEEVADTVVSKAKSFAGRAVDFVKQKFADVKKGREFRNTMRPFDSKIQELQKEGKTTEEILEAIKPDIKSENITDEDIKSYIDTTTGQTDVKAKDPGPSGTGATEEKEVETAEQLEENEQKELEALSFDKATQMKLDAVKKRDKARYKRELRRAAMESAEGQKIVYTYDAKRKLADPNATVAEKVMAKKFLEEGGAYSPAELGAIESSIKKLKAVTDGKLDASELSWNDKKIGKYYDAEILKPRTDEKPTTEDAASKKAAEDGKQTKEKKAQPSDKKAKPKTKVDKALDYANKNIESAKSIFKSLWKKAKSEKQVKPKKGEQLDMWAVPGFRKKMKGAEAIQVQPTVLQYYAANQPVLEGEVMAAASKKFPNKQLLILRQVIDEHGIEIAGMALGSAVQVKSGSDVGNIIMHEYGHVYYAMMKDNPSFKRGVSKIVGSKIFRDIKNRYSEELLYNITVDGNTTTLTGNDLFIRAMQNKSEMSPEIQEQLDAFLVAQQKGDAETMKSVFDKFTSILQETGSVKVLPDSQQENIIEEAFVTSLGSQMAGNLNLFFDKGPDVVQYEGFLKRLKGRISRMITPKDAKDILKNVDQKFENMSLEEMNNAIIDDITTGVNKGKFRSGKPKHLKFGALSKDVGASVSLEINKSFLDTNNLPFEKRVDKIIDNLVADQKNSDIKDQLLDGDFREVIEARLANEIAIREGHSLHPDGNNSPGVSKIYKEAGYNSYNVPQDGSNIDEDNHASNMDEYVDGEGEANVNVLSDDYQRQLAMDNSSSHLIKAIMMIANPRGKNREHKKAALDAKLWQIAKEHRNRPSYFINALKNSGDKDIQKLMEILDTYLEPEERMRVLNEFHNNFRNKFLENLVYTTIKSDGSIMESESIATSERTAMRKIIKDANNIFFKSKDAEAKKEVLGKIKAARKKVKEGGTLTMRESLMIVAPVLYLSDNKQYLDMNALTVARIPYKGKLLTLPEFTQAWIMDPKFSEYIVKDKISVQTTAFKSLVETMVVKSRGINGIKTVSNVDGRRTMVMNNNSHLLNQQQYLTDLAKTEKGRQDLLDFYPGNPFIKMLVSLGKRGLENEAFKISVDAGTVSLVGSRSKSTTYQDKTGDDIAFGDLEQFVDSRMKMEKGDKTKTYYTQPISIFSNSKRRYSIQAPMFITENDKAAVKEELKDNGILNETYKDGTKVLDLSNINEHVEALKQKIVDNPAILRNNKVLAAVASLDKNGNVVFTKDADQILNDYVFNYSVNTIYAQKLLVGEHTQSKSEADYIKRATGSIARHDGSMRGVSIEPLIVQDIIIDGMNTTDGAAFILPEDVAFVQDRVGPRIGHVFKFVHYGTDKRSDDANMRMEDEDVYLKTSVHVLTPELLGKSPELKNVADKLRDRRNKNGFGESLNIAVFESGAKKYPDLGLASRDRDGQNTSAIPHDLQGAEWDAVQDKMDEIYMTGNKLTGLDGSNMGIQVPLDKDQKQVNSPVQTVGNNNNDLMSDQDLMDMNEIQRLEKEIYDANLEEAVGALLADAKESTPESRQKVKELLGRVVGNNAISQVSNGVAKMMIAGDPNISQNLPAMHSYYGNAIRSLIRKSSKIVTNGGIAIETTSVGKGLKAFTSGVRYDSRGRKRNVTLPAEAMVPAAFKGRYLARVDSKPDGSKFTSAQDLKDHIDRNMVKIGSSKQGGIRIKGLDRVWETELEAKEFLYSQMARLEDGSFVILGEEFLGARIPAHGQQSRKPLEIVGFQTEVKSKDGKFQNNVIQIPAELDKVWGSDYDGDGVFMNFRNDNPKTQKDRTTNQYIRKTIEFYEKPSRLDESKAHLDINEEIEARVDAVKKRLPSRDQRFSQSTPLGASQFFEENVTGSGMTGNVAALNNGMAYMSRYGVGLGVTISIDGTTQDSFNNDWQGDYSDNALSFKAAKTLQVVLDNAANQQATILGLNPSTIVAGSILPRIGFSPSQTDLILNSHGAKLYAKHKGKKALRNRNYSYKSPAEAALAELHGEAVARKKIEQWNAEAKNGGLVKIDTNLIVDGKPELDSTYNERVENEEQIIKLLHRLEGVGQDVYMVNSLLGQHKTVPTNKQEATEMKENVDNLLNGESTVKGAEALRELKSNTAIKAFRERLEALESVYANNQITGTWHADETFKAIKEMVGGHGLFKSDGNQQSKLLDDYMINIIMNYSPKISKAIGTHARAKDTGEIKVNSMMEQLQRLHRENELAEDQNEFLNAITIIKYDEYIDRKTGEVIREDSWKIGLNRDYINENTRPFEIEAIKRDFAKLPIKVQEQLLAADAILNGGGLSNTTISPLFDNRTLVSISKSIDAKHQEILSKTSGALADPEVVAEAIVVENPDVVETIQRWDKSDETFKVSIDGKFGDAELKLKNPVSDIQRNSMRANKPHYVKTQKGNEFAIYKWVPAPANKFDKDNWKDTSKKYGKYVLVGKAKKGKKTSISNLKRMERQAQNRNAVTSLILEGKSGTTGLKMKMNNTRSGGEQGYGSNYKEFSFDEYVADKGYTPAEVAKNKPLREALDKLYRQYKENFKLAQEFDQNIVQTGKLSSISESRLTDYALLFQKLDPSAISGAHRAVVTELAKRAAESQKASRNGIEWTDKGDISWLHAWFGSNNIPGHRPEIQKLVREMEKEYDNFMDENIKFQKELDRLTKNLIRDRLGEGVGVAGKIWSFTKWFTGGLKESQNEQAYGNMYDRVTTYVNGKPVTEMKLKSRTDFLRTKPSKAEREFYEFFRKTTDKYGKITQGALGERFKEGYIPHMQMGLFASMRQRGLFGLYDYMLQGTGDIDHVRVKGVNPITGKTEVMPFHEWKYLYYTEKGVKGIDKKKQFKAVASLDIIRKRAEGLAKSGKHEDGKPISRTEQEIHGMMGTNLMSRFTKSRGVKASMFGSADLGRALSQYVNTTLFTYGNENFKGFKSMTPLLDGVIRYNKDRGNKNAVTYLENVWKRGFYSFKESQSGLGRLTDTALHKLIKLTRIRYLSLSFAGGFGNLTVGKYNEFRSKGGRKFLTGEKRYWGERKKSWALIKKQLNPESFAYDLIQGNDSSGFDSIMMSPYIGSEHYIQGSGFVSQFTEAEWARISEDGDVPADLKDKVDLYVDNVVRQQGYGYSKVDQIGIATYSWGKAIMQFKKWMPTAVTERFQKETIDRFGEMRAGSNATAFAFGADFARGIMSGEESIKDFRKKFKNLPSHKQEAVRTFFRGMQVVSALTVMSMLFGDSDDDELRGLANWADDSVDDIMFMVDPRRIKNAAEPASWSLVESGSTMAIGMATMDQRRFVGGLRGVSWTAAQVLSETKS